MGNIQIALFGEAEKGKYHFPYSCESLEELFNHLGNPPKETVGLNYAIQAILYKRRILFLRVHEEGFSKKDYLKGLKTLEEEHFFGKIDALFLPGVGDEEILSQANIILFLHNSLLLTREQDMYDYFTS